MPAPALKGIAKQTKQSLEAVEKDWDYGLMAHVTKQKAKSKTPILKKSKDKLPYGYLEEIPELSMYIDLPKEEAMQKAIEETSCPELYPNDMAWQADRFFRFGVYSGTIDPTEDTGNASIGSLLRKAEKAAEEIKEKKEVEAGDRDVHETRESYVPKEILAGLPKRKEQFDTPRDRNDDADRRVSDRLYDDAVNTTEERESEGEDKKLTKAYLPIKKSKELLVGGKADQAGKSPKDFPKAKLKQGMAVEKEHTKNPEAAAEITADHLEEDMNYYDKLKAIEPEKLAKSLNFWDSSTGSWKKLFKQ